MAHDTLVTSILQLLREASIEINAQDAQYLEASRAYLAAGTKVYVSHLPRQTWQHTEAACRAVRDAGFEPVPHIPVRLMPDAVTLDRTLAALTRNADVQDVLLIAGDYAQPFGPYEAVADVLRSGMLEKHALSRVSVAGHPEGHPAIPREAIRTAEVDKVRLATQAKLELTLLTQFFFEPAPFIEWVADLRARGIGARVVAGLAGPAGLATLFRFAMRCGVGPSIRALGTRPTSLMRLAGEHGPQRVIRGLAAAKMSRQADFTGIHFFCFGGFLRTCEWLHRAASGDIQLNDQGGFDVATAPAA